MMLYYAKIGINWDDIDPQIVYPDMSWLSNVNSSGICPLCKCINRQRYPAPADVMIERSPNEDQTSVLIETTNITIWKKDFVEKLSLYRDGFAIGKCFTSDGRILDDYVTCYLRKCITIRGNKQSRYQLCQSCGAIISNVEPGPKYVLEKELDGSRIYQDALCRFYVTEDVVDDFDEPQEDLAFNAVSVRNTPAEG